LMPLSSHLFLVIFLFHDTATSEIYTLSLHDALPILVQIVTVFASSVVLPLIPSISKKLSERDLTGSKQLIENTFFLTYLISIPADRKSTRLNSSHVKISYAVFCLKKKKNENKTSTKD